MTNEELLEENKALRELVQHLTNKLDAIKNYIEFYEKENLWKN